MMIIEIDLILQRILMRKSSAQIKILCIQTSPAPPVDVRREVHFCYKALQEMENKTIQNVLRQKTAGAIPATLLDQAVSTIEDNGGRINIKNDGSKKITIDDTIGYVEKSFEEIVEQLLLTTSVNEVLREHESSLRKV